MSTYRILFLGDIVGRPGREAVKRHLPKLLQDHQPRFVIANGENAASGVGITPDIAEDLFKAGVDAITLGNHAFNKREIFGYLDAGHPIIRPANLPAGAPGIGRCEVTREGVTLAIYNLCGRVFLDGYDDPFRLTEEMVAAETTSHIFVDFHAEATSEKIAMAYHLEGRVTAVVGTHTHVTTADERVLPGGTAAITDVGMCGPENGVLGMDRSIILNRFRTSLPQKFEVADGVGVISGVVIDVETDTGRATGISRVRVANQE
ncbi:MAG: 2',3'-cyclic-nucleotide 2'-phosphodiesterase [Fimbriimonadaceae bacterium]|nr:2',3'-cyclic-nucleotide 2'-phosphodiesterase [Fimbriimonadaceae bacterium]